MKALAKSNLKWTQEANGICQTDFLTKSGCFFSVNVIFNLLAAYIFAVKKQAYFFFH